MLCVLRSAQFALGLALRLMRSGFREARLLPNWLLSYYTVRRGAESSNPEIIHPGYPGNPAISSALHNK
jgi:hypothetical protein